MASAPMRKSTNGKRPAPRKASPKRKSAAARGEPVRLMRIRELDPHAACGSGTTVMQLFRVDELPTAHAATHLVFFDRRGWYCEHGRNCPAVDAVRKQSKQTSSRR